MNLEKLNWEEFVSYVEQHKTASSGNSGNVDFLEKANVLLTIDRYISQLSTFDKNIINQTVLKEFQDAWEKVKKNTKLTHPAFVQIEGDINV